MLGIFLLSVIYRFALTNKAISYALHGSGNGTLYTHLLYKNTIIPKKFDYSDSCHVDAKTQKIVLITLAILARNHIFPSPIV